MNKPAKMMSLASALLLTIALTACGQANAPAPEPGDTANTTQEPPVETTPDETTEPAEPDTPDEEVISATGEYNGQADPHTIEVNVDGTPTSFQLAEGVSSQLEGLNEGDTISFEYVERAVEGSDVPQLEIRSLEKAATSGADGGASGDSDAASTDRPATETFTVGDGESQTLTGELQTGEGYSLYVLDGYALDAATGRVTLTENPDYYAEIEKLPADFNLDELRTEGTAKLEKAGGTVEEFSADTLVESSMMNASLFLQGSSAKDVQDYIVWEAQDGSAYTFHLVIPENEEGSSFYTEVTASLATIMGQ
ncbi:hypothetical protein [Saccharibacillus sacchari]|uniref:Uncharacterized protein n=1 Tax=Saccharibacillus sacchari TaxID=456493 RepID=A0ACC6PDQ4_9BACL